MEKAGKSAVGHVTSAHRDQRSDSAPFGELNVTKGVPIAPLHNQFATRAYGGRPFFHVYAGAIAGVEPSDQIGQGRKGWAGNVKSITKS